MLINPDMDFNSEVWQSLVDCSGLENRHTVKGIVGSNPTTSATSFYVRLVIRN